MSLMRWCNMKISVKKTAYYGLFLSLAIILSYLEHLIPLPLPIGMKIGFANIIIVFLIYQNKSFGALIISVLRVLIINLLFSSLTGFLFGLSGAVLSIFVMLILKKTDLFTEISVSAAGGVFHNVAQIFICIFITDTTAIISYATVLIPTGLLTGILIGAITRNLLKRDYLKNLTKL